eukprot:4705804-Prymnesium_polylepis.2
MRETRANDKTWPVLWKPRGRVHWDVAHVHGRPRLGALYCACYTRNSRRRVVARDLRYGKAAGPVLGT